MLFRIFALAVFMALPCFAPAMADDDTTQQTQQIQSDTDVDNIKNNLELFGWCKYDEVVNSNNISNPDAETDDSDISSRQLQYIQICRHAQEIQNLEAELSQNMTALEDNYQDMKDNEQSTANRMLGGATMATTGIGGMELAMGLAEQNADKHAEEDMQAYLATFQCKVGDTGAKSYRGGEMGIGLTGGNQLTSLYQQYVDLAADLKERKNALGMAPGIESTVVMDKANMGLYDDTGRGIENGTYASLYRASRGNETDMQKLAEQKDTSGTRVKAGAIATGVGVVGSIVGNQIINHGKHDKSSELLAQREDIKNKYNNLVQQIILECNKNIADAKANIPPEDEFVIENTSIGEPQTYQEFVDMINSMQPLQGPDDITRIKDIPVCRQ